MKCLTDPLNHGELIVYGGKFDPSFQGNDHSNNKHFLKAGLGRNNEEST
jgi:hypothetical protein